MTLRDVILNFITRWLTNIVFILASFGVFTLFFDDISIAALLTIALSDLYLGKGR